MRLTARPAASGSETQRTYRQFICDNADRSKRIAALLLSARGAGKGALRHPETGAKAILEWLMRKDEVTVSCFTDGTMWVGPDVSTRDCQALGELGNLKGERFRDIVYARQHAQTVRGCQSLDCPKFHQQFDKRVRWSWH